MKKKLSWYSLFYQLIYSFLFEWNRREQKSLRLKNIPIGMFLGLFFLSEGLLAQTHEIELQSMVDSFYKTHPKSVGIMMAVESSGQPASWNYAVGYADNALKTPIHPLQPALTASNTKTYVAAAILKLVEKGQLDIEQGIYNIINKKTDKQLVKAGYQTKTIKIKHLLSHTSGIADYIDDNYFEFVKQHKKYRWTREEQIKLATTIGKPMALPGDTFKYADINYLLATEIIENRTHQPFYTAIPELLEFEKNHLTSTWFVTLQSTPVNSKSLVHQYYDKFAWDSYDIDPSWDLYGGGGIATSTKELAVFFQLLFEGKMIHDTNLLAKMYTNMSAQSNYCLGIRKLSINGYKAYYHGGWWGTDVMYFPELKTAISVYVLERSEKGISSEICKRALQILGN